MAYFLNLVDGELSINTFRKPECMNTSIEDLVICFEEHIEEDLTACIDNWILAGNAGSSNGNDELEALIESLGFKMYDYPDLRDLQREVNGE